MGRPSTTAQVSAETEVDDVADDRQAVRRPAEAKATASVRVSLNIRAAYCGTMSRTTASCESGVASGDHAVRAQKRDGAEGRHDEAGTLTLSVQAQQPADKPADDRA